MPSPFTPKERARLRSAPVTELVEMLADCEVADLPALVNALRLDKRAGVRNALKSARERIRAHEREQARLDSLWVLERSLGERGYHLVAGIDEVGRGSLAGPVTAAAVVFREGAWVEGLNDSKLLEPERREELAVEIRAEAVTWSVHHVSSEDIDAIGIANAVKRAMSGAVAGLDPQPDHVLVDGLPVHVSPEETAIVGGDSKCAAIAAASILAKVTRDALMVEYHEVYPDYGFVTNKGYGTSDHLKAITRLGLCPLHRRSYAPCGGTLPLFIDEQAI